MPHRAGEGQTFDIPENLDLIQAPDFVDRDNDLVVESRQEHFVYRGDAIGPFNMQRLDRVEDAPFTFNSKMDRYGNSGITRLDILGDGDKW